MESWAGTSDREPPELERAPEGTPLYVHLPFCASKCHYCDFYSLPDAGQDIDGTLDSVLQEARTRAPRNPRTVFFGGGTPSLLSIDQWRRFADELDAITGFRDAADEVTAECNPESLDRDKAAALLDLGIPRLSIGFQSLNDQRLEDFGRVHDHRASFEAYAAARDAGVERVNVDLIFAAPGQTLEEWQSELDRVLALRPDSFSAYNLTIEEGTLFHRWHQQGRLERAPEDTELAMFHAARRTAQEQGYEAYEVSNFSLPGAHCEHNINYWQNGPYLGLGPSAVSKVGPTRLGNVRILGPYRARMRETGQAIDWRETLAPDHRLAETWWLGLRMERGLNPEDARRAAECEDPEALERARGLADDLVEKGLLELLGDAYRLSPAGRPLADAVAAEFLRRVPLETHPA